MKTDIYVVSCSYMLKADFLLTWPNKKPKRSMLLVYNWMPIFSSVKMFAAFMNSNHFSMLLFYGYVGYVYFPCNLRKLCS